MRERYSSKKKLGVLVSSLALVAVTAMAGVTGTAAWFTANRSQTAQASTFTAYAPENNLTITAKGDVTKGTYSTGNTGDSSVSVKNGANGEDNYLRDASYDAANKTLYKAFVDDSGKATSFEAVTDYDTTATTKESGGKVHKIFYAVSWTYTFSYTNPGSNGSALFFDPAASKFDSNTGVAPGFRIAFNFGTNSYLVWANDAVITYVNGTTDTSIANTAVAKDDHFVQSDTGYSRQDDGISAENAAKEKTYLGTFKKTDDDVNEITVTCTAWYEGTDEAVKTKELSDSKAITAKMTFYTRDLAKANS